VNKKSRSKSKASRLRCAIYTRKSSEEGLEQDFNSLDAQREACEAYVKSQRNEGWDASPAQYDDGGFSGGTMERSGLQRLLSDVKAGKVDVVVVYKVDRLTRSLSDFARIVDILDAQKTSFVSVTQQFNTTTSMGRLTLNVLLSFAQFEREVTGERIRDKIAASKKKGMWMGGYPPLGYEAVERKLAVHAQESRTVRHIFKRYAELGSVRKLKEALDAAGIVSKVRKTKTGRVWGGKPFARGALYAMLQNRIYLGKVVHKGQSYPGKHEAIVDQALWKKVEKTLAAGRVGRCNGSGAKDPSLLAGLLFDDLGERMTPTHAVKKGKRYRYYVSRSLILNPRSASKRGRRVPAGDIEEIVTGRLRKFLSNNKELLEAVEPLVPDGAGQKMLIDAATSLAADWPGLERPNMRDLILSIILRIDIHQERVDIQIAPAQVTSVLRGEPSDQLPPDEDVPKAGPLTLTVLARLRRTGMEMKMLVDGETISAGKADRSLVRLIVKAHALREKLESKGGIDFGGMTRQFGTGRAHHMRLLRLSFLAPDIIKAILEGRHPKDLTAARLMRNTQLPLSWREQRETLGFV
jgi:DNA invertase Pin-like site-specific DNA recombinase